MKVLTLVTTMKSEAITLHPLAVWSRNTLLPYGSKPHKNMYGYCEGEKSKPSLVGCISVQLVL